MVLETEVLKGQECGLGEIAGQVIEGGRKPDGVEDGAGHNRQYETHDLVFVLD